MAPRTYWAAKKTSECVNECMARIRAHREAIARTGRADRMTRAYSSYYGGGVDGRKSSARLLPGGEQGELTMLVPPIFATLARQTERLITGQKPAFKTVASNSDSDAVVEAMLGDALLDHYDRAASLTQRENEAVRSGILFGAGSVALSWRPSLGREVGIDPDSGRVVREGDVDALYLTPWDVAFDFRDADAERRQWVAFRTRAKRFDLAAQYPDVADEVLSAPSAEKGADTWDTSNSSARPWRMESETADEDNVWLWELRHIRTPALPNGRIVRFVTATCVLYDSAAQTLQQEAVEGEDAQTATQDVGYPYHDLCVYEYCPETVLGTSDGYTSQFDLLGLQEACEAIVTAGMTNINMGAVTNWWVRPGDAPNVQRLSTGANVIESNVKPETIDGVQVSPAMMAFLDLCRSFMTEAVGLNDVALGKTEKGMPAQLAALLEAKALQYHAQGQASYYRLVEKVRTGVLKMLQRFAREPRVAQLVGAANAWALKEWSAKDIASVDKVTVEPVNPMMKTFAGRMSMLDVLGPDLPRDAKMSLMLTGSIEEKLDGPRAHEGRLAKEKEMLRRGVGLPPVDMQASMEAGVPVFAPTQEDAIRPLPSDLHWLDIPEYLSVLESPESRGNPRVVTAVLDLVEEKLRLWRTMSPDLLMLRNGPPAPSSMGMMGPPPGEMGPPPPEEGPPPEMMSAGGDAPDVKMPSPPPNPLAGTQEAPPIPAV